MLGIQFHVDLQNIYKLNYNEKVIKMESILKQWKRRNLTPLGKITVIKTLLMSLFNHLFISLPNPPLDFVKYLTDLFTDFIWDGPSRIKLSTLTRDYCEGGLKMINVEAFIYSMKLTWIRRIFTNNGKWLSIANMYIDFNKIINCGRHYPETMSKRITNPFWKDVLQSLVHYYEKLPFNHEYAFQNPLFYNENICIGNKSIFFNSLYKAGLQYICDLFDNNGQFLKRDVINRKYNLKLDFLLYKGIEKAVNAMFKKFNISQNSCNYQIIQRPFIPPAFKLILLPESGAKRMYTTYNKNDLDISVKRKWIEEKKTILKLMKTIGRKYLQYHLIPIKMSNFNGFSTE
jgi:hypothetical protein